MGYDIVVMEECASWHSSIEVKSDSSDKTYTTHWYGPEGGADCSCPAFKYSGDKRDCKHLAKAFKEGCFWHQQWSDEELKETGTCPRCGGETIYVRCAV